MTDWYRKRLDKGVQRLLICAVAGLVLLVQALFFMNMVFWLSSPDRGWIALSEMGPDIVAWTRPLGEKAGLQRGDRILTINGREYETFEEMYDLLDNDIGHLNEYQLERNGEILTVSIPTGKLGWRNVLLQSGIYWLLGMVFLGMGILVFSMKPYHGPSWAFFVMTAALGIYITYSASSSGYTPPWLSKVLMVCLPFIPASIFHLAVLFPERRAWIADRKLLIALFYVFSLALVIASLYSSAGILDVPATLVQIIYLYLIAALLMFLGSALYSYFKPSSMAVKLQSLVIFTGITVALFIPSLEMLSNVLFHVSFLAGQIFYYLIFLVFFPLSIGYAIVRHDLFEIDVIVRRTYGYVLSTATIIGGYSIIVSGLNVISHGADISKSPVFSVGFALGVVFFFRPLHERLQGFIDRVFYRQQYDYRQTIRDISEAMIRILDPQQIYQTLIGSVVNEMFLENGVLLLPNPEQKVFSSQVINAGGAVADMAGRQLPTEGALAEVLQEKSGALMRHQIDLDPAYEDKRESLQDSFASLDSELMLPLKYQDAILGIISLGRKKSGKMFTPEDLDLLMTITNQSAVALENARLFAENIEKSRMEEELKIAHDIQISMLPEFAPEIEGYSIAASSFPAREVGGDFYDFIEIGRENRKKLGIIVGDVSGKAVSGALVMAASRSIFRVLADSAVSVSDMVLSGNRRLKHDVKKGMFVALVYAMLDPLKKTLTIVNAGQTQPILCSGKSKKPLYIDTEGDRFPLGIIEDCDYQETVITLEQGDTVVLYTDGIVEAMNEAGDMYGFDHFIEEIEKNKQLEADAFLRNLMADVTRFVGDAEQHDDLTIVVLRVE